ncbi:MAG: tetratricopeptide repeat protein, partial [Flavobacteriales bacterium]
MSLYHRRATAPWAKAVGLLLALLPTAQLRAQEEKGDSLLVVWNDTTRPDSVRYSACFDLIYDVLIYTWPDSALAYAEDLRRFTSKQGMQKAEVSSMSLIASCRWVMGEYDAARAAFGSVYELASRRGYADIASSALANIGTLFLSQGRNDSGMHYLGKGIELLRAEGLREQAALAVNNMAVMLNSMGQQAEAARAYDEAIRELEAIGDVENLATAEANLGMIYRDLGDYAHAEEVYARAEERLVKAGDMGRAASVWMNQGSLWYSQDSLQRARGYWSRALATLKNSEKGKHLANAYNNMGQVLLKLGHPDSAVMMHREALAICERINDLQSFGATWAGLADASLTIGNAREAVRYGTMALKASHDAEDINMEEQIHAILHQAYSAIGDMANAYGHAQALLSLRDTSRTQDEQRILLRMEYQHTNDRRALADSVAFAVERAEKLREIDRQKLVRNGFVGGFALVALFAGVFFVQRNRISREKKRSEELLLNILPEEVAEELKAKGEADAKQIEQVTVLFTDFKGFTAMSEQLTPKELVKDLHECFSAFDAIMHKHNIEKIKTIGDAYMAAGGVPDPSGSMPLAVVHAALEMQGIMAERQVER